MSAEYGIRISLREFEKLAKMVAVINLHGLEAPDSYKGKEATLNIETQATHTQWALRLLEELDIGVVLKDPVRSVATLRITDNQ
jgi:hypothetical protein